MKSTLGSRIIAEHGLISNILQGFNLVDLISLAGVTKRVYDITIPWNAIRMLMPVSLNTMNAFPRIDEV